MQVVEVIQVRKALSCSDTIFLMVNHKLKMHNMSCYSKETELSNL